VTLAMSELRKQLHQDTEECGKHLEQLGSEAVSRSSKLQVVTRTLFALF
jgi:hypothetical protein